MMDHLLPVGWTDLATSREVAELRDWATVRFDQMATRADIADVRVEIAAVRGDLTTEMANLRAEVHRGFHRQTLALVILVCTLNGAMAAALRLG